MEDFRKIFLTERYFDFIPIGFNLPFEFKFLFHKFKEFGNPIDPFHIIDKPSIDMKSIFVILNNGNFSGCGLDKFTNKKSEGHLVGPRYTEKRYEELEEYIRQEAGEFINAYQILKLKMPELLIPHLSTRVMTSLQ